MKEPVRLSDLHKGPIRHPVLSDEFIERIKTLKAMLGDVDPTTLEQTIDNFKRDANPESELLIWERIANTFQLFVSDVATANAAMRKDVIAVLVGASMGSEDWSSIKHLSEDQIARLVLIYRGLSALTS
jgi:hypothetical protein